MLFVFPRGVVLIRCVLVKREIERATWNVWKFTYFILHPFVVGGDVVCAVGHEEEAGGQNCCTMKIWS